MASAWTLLTGAQQASCVMGARRVVDLRRRSTQCKPRSPGSAARAEPLFPVSVRVRSPCTSRYGPDPSVLADVERRRGWPPCRVRQAHRKMWTVPISARSSNSRRSVAARSGLEISSGSPQRIFRRRATSFDRAAHVHRSAIDHRQSRALRALFPVDGAFDFSDPWNVYRAHDGDQTNNAPRHRHHGEGGDTGRRDPSGKIEKIGWNCLGGWRLWIAARRHRYYYVHLRA